MNKGKLKLFGLIIFTTALIIIRDLWLMTAIFAAIIFWSVLFIKKRKIVDRIYPLIIVGIFIILFQIVFNNSILFNQRIILGFMTAQKIICLSLLVFIFTETTSVKEMTSIFSFLPKQLQLMFIISFSLIPVLIDETKKISLVQASRGLSSHNFNLYKRVIPVIIPLLHRTLKRAEQIAMTIESRGYEI